MGGGGSPSQTFIKNMKNIITKILSAIFPFKELDTRPDYTFTDETFVAGMFRRNQVLDWKAK
jgi:hypothetical protein